MSCTSFEVSIEDNIKGLAVMCIMNILKNQERKDLYFDNINLVVKTTNDTLNLFQEMKERDRIFKRKWEFYRCLGFATKEEAQKECDRRNGK